MSSKNSSALKFKLEFTFIHIYIKIIKKNEEESLKNGIIFRLQITITFG